MRKTLCTTVALALASYCMSAWAAEPNKKDLNNDGKVNNKDAIALATAILNETATVERYDMNGDNKVDVADVIYILKHQDAELSFGGEESGPGVAEAPVRTTTEE